MTIAYVALEVENLPKSTSFFLAALQPLGYRYIGIRGDQIAFGVEEANFFLSEADP